MEKIKKQRKWLSLKQVTVQTGIPINQLKIIKGLYPEAFTVNQIYVDKVVKFYEDNKEQIVAQDEKSIEALKKEKLTGDIILQKIEIEEAKKQVIAIKDVEEFMRDFGVQLSAALKSKVVKELPPKITGLKEEDVTTICKDFYNELVKLFQSNVKIWNNKQQID